MKPKSTSTFKVVPTNIRNGATAPYFIIEGEPKMKRDEVRKLAQEEFSSRSSLSRSENWGLEVEKI